MTPTVLPPPAPAQAALAGIVCFCLGSAAYRGARQAAFAQAIPRLPAAGLADWLTASHLGGLFVEACGASPATSAAGPVVAALEPRIRLETAFHRHLLAELHEIGQALTGLGLPARPAVMKGVSHWDYYADGVSTRRIRDLDLLIGAAADGDAICDALEFQGYQSLRFEDDDREARAYLREGDSFSAPPYRIRRRVDLPPDLEAQVRAQAAGPAEGPPFGWADAVVATVDVEIHMALLRTETGALVRTRPEQLGPSRIAPRFEALRPGPALAYAATKFSLDMVEALSSGSGSFKCLKLGADVLRILQSCGQEDFEAAFAAAGEWDCLHHLVDILRAAAPLLPERDLLDLPDPGGETLFSAFLGNLPDLQGAPAHA